MLMLILIYLLGFLSCILLQVLMYYWNDITTFSRKKLAKLGIYQIFCYYRLKYKIKNNPCPTKNIKSLLDGGYIKQHHYEKLLKYTIVNKSQS